MPGLSIAVLVGRLTRDAEIKYTNSGAAICHFSVATSTKKKKGDAWVDEASFWDVELWGKLGESLNQYLMKGKQVAVEGSMRQDRWEQDGTPRMKVVVNANTVQLLGSNPVSQGQASQGQTAERQPDRSQARPGPPQADDFADDIPF
jgi:single-strand DNA-binding protein